MISQKRIFDGGMNADDSLRLLSDREYLQLMNGRVGKSRTGKDYRVENVPGTLQLVSGLLPAGTNMTIGSAVDESRNRLIYFNYNSNGDHGIYAYDLLTSTSYKILLNAQVSGGLNFSLTNRIDRNARVVGDQLYWTDNFNEPRCLNIERGIKLNQSGYSTSYTAYASPLLYTDLTLIKRTPIFALTVAKVTDSGFPNNLTSNSSFQFCYRYNYKDNQVSALSEFSNLIPANYQSETYNAVDITMPVAEQIDDYVQSVDFVVRFGNAGNSFVIKSLNKDITADATSISNHNGGTAFTFRFYNNKLGTALDSITANTSSDYVPLLTKTLEISRNRLFVANNLVGYDSTKITSLGVSNTDTSTPNDNVPIITGTAANIGFNTPTTIPFALTGAPITSAGNYVIRNQSATSASNDETTSLYPTYPSDTDCIFWNTSTTKTYSFSLSAKAYMYNDNVDSQISIIAYLCSSPNTKKIQKFATFTTTKLKRYNDRKINIQVQVPPLTKVFIAGYPDLGVTGFNDNQLQLTNVKCYLTDITNLSYGNPIFKTGSSYKGAITFFDRFKRKCGVVTQDTATMTVANRSYATNPNNTGAWSLSNVNAINEIPSWAYYYQVQLSKSLAKQTYIQGAAYDMRYGTKDITTGLPIYEEYNYATTAFCIAINIKGLTDAGLGYTFTEGDQVYIYSDGGASYTLRVTGIDGYWLQAEKKDIGTLGSFYNWGCEVYSPFIGSISENYYAASPVYAITNPTLSTRTYATLSGSLIGDTYYVYRTQGTSFFYKAEAMNPNDRNWSVWDRSLGWLSLVDSIGQKQKVSSIQFSDTFINGTKNNGLSKFEVLNTKDIGSDSGGIMKLQLTNKQGQQIGTVLLIVAQSDTISAYLSESQITASAQNAFVATSVDVIGSMNSLKNNYGTLSPESLFAYMGSVYWYDMQNGGYIQYSDSGNVKISAYKFSKFFTSYASDYMALGSSAITAINGFSHIPTCYDPFRNELMVSLPALTTTNNLLPSYSNTIPSYATSINNYFDPYDKLAKTVTFNNEKNKWISTFQFLPEWMELVNTDVFMFKNGVLWKKEADLTNYNTFFGVQQPLRLAFTPNSNPSEVKDVANLGIESNLPPDYSVIMSDYPNQQITDIVASEFTQKEGVWYAAVPRDRLSPNSSGTAFERSLVGDFVKSVTPLICLEWQKYNGLLEVDFVNVGCLTSKGHTSINRQ